MIKTSKIRASIFVKITARENESQKEKQKERKKGGKTPRF
jgi:hypothetical protein